VLLPLYLSLKQERRLNERFHMITNIQKLSQLLLIPEGYDGIIDPSASAPFLLHIQRLMYDWRDK
jgi:hypothetical protein